MAGRQRVEDGSSTTELVLVMPVVLAIVMLLVQVGLYMHARQVVEAAAQEAMEAAQGEFAEEADGITAGNGFLAEAGGVRDAKVDVDRDAVRVEAWVTGVAPNVVPGMAWRVESTVSGEVERFVPEVSP